VSKVADHFGDKSDLDIQVQIHRYFVARYDSDYVFRGPETFENVVEQWMLSICHDDPSYAHQLIEEIEEFWNFKNGK
jgi:hypothetical protein